MVVSDSIGKNEAVLVNLLWALQGHLLSWCYLQLKESDVLSVQHAREILLNCTCYKFYARLLLNKEHHPSVFPSDLNYVYTFCSFE